MDLAFIQPLIKKNNKKIVFLILDGLGGLPQEDGGLTELETAVTPHLDNLAKKGICGLQQPVLPAITPGSGPGHLGVFGYDPVKYQIGRGVLEGLGIDFELRSNDVAARGNFCTLDEQGNITDRRAGRISTEKNKELCTLLQTIELPEVQLFVKPVKEHRLLVVFRGDGLSEHLEDTDPQDIGKKPLEPKGMSSEDNPTAELVKQFLEQAKDILSDHHPANMVLLRGFSQKPQWPSMNEAFGLKSAAIAGYPMYRGLAKLLGMTVLETSAEVEHEFKVLKQQWDNYDFFYVHVKGTDSAGEDGDFSRKVQVIETVDQYLPQLLSVRPDVIVVTGDHSTPSKLKKHSWHPVPVLLWSKHCRADSVNHFGERDCIAGGLGPRFPAVDLVPLSLAHAQRLEKFGA